MKMNSAESAKCFTHEIRKRWPRWTPSEVEISDWLIWLEKYEYAAITIAARKHLAESRYAKPIPSQLLDHAKTITADRTPPSKRNSNTIPDEHTFIMCVARSTNGGGCVGHFVPILIWPFHKTYTAETYRRAAEEQRLMHSRNGRAGVWEIFTNTTHSEMFKRSCDLRGIKPLDLTELRKRYKHAANRQKATAASKSRTAASE
jgi:hypothetical protein